MEKYVLEFEKGGVFEVKFFEDAASKTVKAFKEALPLSGGCLQARFAGEEFFFNAPSIDVEEENTILPYHGAIAFNSDPEWRAVCIYYGSTIAMDDGVYYNLFAEIVGDLEELNQVGLRIWKQGAETVTLKKTGA
jgi:hypothetical protein